MGGISIWQLAIILAIVLLLFGTKRLRNLGGDLGGAIKGFKKAMSDEDSSTDNGKHEKGPDSLSAPYRKTTADGQSQQVDEKQKP